MAIIQILIKLLLQMTLIVVSLTDRDIKLTLMTSSTTLTEGGYKGSGAVWTFHLYTSDDEIDLYNVESEEFVSTIKGNYTGDYTFVR
ncbi:hypothetical protein [Aestuariivivens sediminis]|uniref:hypothetical protein n=1 Tax=Aestuariivivens sediminis TaxID=2913557 RepID=UPI001F55BD27|nr:hypothetical protein [Aestuariivivens sediminis]